MTKKLVSLLWRYGLAILAFALPLLLSMLLRRLHIVFDPTWLLLAALIAAAWFLGRGPGLLVALLLALAFSYFSPPPYKLKSDFASFNRLVLLTALAVMTSARRKAETKLKLRARQQAAVAEFGQRALAAHALSPLTPLIDEAAAIAARHLEVEYSSVLELLPDGQTLQLQAGVGWKENLIGRALLSTSEGPQADYTLPSREPIVITDLRRETHFPLPPLLRDHQIVSAVSVLISVGDQPYGVLSVHTTQQRKFTADDISFLQAIANILADAIERRHREKAVHEGREWLRVTLASIGDAVIATDTQGRVNFMNAVASALTGWQQEEAIGRPLAEVFHIVNEETRQLAENPVTQVLLQGAVVGLANHTVLIARDGTERAIDDSGAPIRDASGQIIGTVLVFHDVTERRHVERQRAELLSLEQEARTHAEAASRMKDEFLLTVSHELRTPLNSILGWAQLLSRGQLDSTSAVKASASILRNARSQAQIIEDLLDVSRIVAGKMRLKISSVELGPVIETAIETFRLAAEAKNIRLQARLQAEAIKVMGDPDRLLQVIWNLLSNAIKFTPNGGAVEIQVERENAQAKILVKDTGQGISPEFLPYVFDRFRQADSTSTRTFSGVGIGLAIVRHLVELHGGIVRAESPGIGQGATLTILLPVEQQKTNAVKETGPTLLPEKAAAATASYETLDGVQVLVVDDETDTLDLLNTILSQHGAAVTAVDSAAAALESLEQRKPDVLVSDIGMPQENGYELISKIRARSPQAGGNLPAIALTAYARAEDRQRALAAGFHLHVPKPIEPEELVKSIALLIRHHKPTSQNDGS